MKSSRGQTDWLSNLLHAAIGLIFGGLAGIGLSALTGLPLNVTSMPFIFGCALMGAGIGCLTGHHLYGGLLSWFAAPEFPAQSRGSRIFAAALIGSGAVAALTNYLWMHPWSR